MSGRLDHYYVTFWRKGLTTCEVPLPPGTDPARLSQDEWLAAVERKYPRLTGEKSLVSWRRSKYEARS